MSRLSVIVPVYKVEKYLARCLDSIINQTFKDLEIICVNDGSPDNSLQILEDYARRDARIKIISQENQGLSEARNNGVDHATSEYVGFVDSDDWVDPDFYEKLMTAISACDADFAMAGTRLVYEKNSYEDTSKPGCFDTFSEKVKRFPNGAVWNKVFRRRLLIDNNMRFPKGRYFEDNIVLIEAAYYSNKAVFINDTFYNYFQNPAGICKATSDVRMTQKKAEDKLFVARKLLTFGLDKKLNDHEIHLLKSFITRSILLEFVYHENPYEKEVCEILDPKFLAQLRRQKVLREIRRVFYDDYVNQAIRKVRLFGICLYKGFVKSKHRFCIDNSNLLPVLRSLGRFTFIPSHATVGDVLETKAAYDFFDKNSLDYAVIDYQQTPDVFDAIVIGGSDLWLGNESPHVDFYLEQFKKAKRIVILPSGILDCPRLVDVLDSRFTVFVHDVKSYHYLMEQNTGATILLDTDMLLGLDATAVRQTLAGKRNRKAARKMAKAMLKMSNQSVLLMAEDLEKIANDFLYMRSWAMTRDQVSDAAAVILSSLYPFGKFITNYPQIGISALLMQKVLYVLDDKYGHSSALYHSSLYTDSYAHLL